MRDEDAILVLEALFDLRTELRRIRRILEEAYGDEGDTEEDS
jgi:hypothetical protein